MHVIVLVLHYYVIIRHLHLYLCFYSIGIPRSRVLGKLRGGRLISELISLSVVSECTFYAVLDSFSTRGYGKNCPVKIFEVYVEILGVLSVGRICGDRGGWKIKRR